MLSFYLFQTKVCVQYAFLFVCLLFLIFNVPFIPLFFALLVHELGHILIALLFKIHISKAELSLLGCLIFYDNAEEKSKFVRILFALFGPLCSFLSLVLCAQLLKYNILPYAFLTDFVQKSALLFVFNILPFYPLDGGKILSELLQCFITRKKSIQILTFFTRTFACFLLLFTFYNALLKQIYYFPMIAALYLLYSVQVEHHTSLSFLHTCIQKRHTLYQQGFLKVECLVCLKSTPFITLLPHITNNKYHLIYFLNEQLEFTNEIYTENQILDKILEENQNTPS